MKFPARICLLVLALCVSAASDAPAQPAASPDSEPPWLVREGTFRGKIFLPANPAAEEREAAEALALWVKKVTGAAPQIATENPEVFAQGIYLGATRHAAQRKIAAPRSLGETWHWEPAGHGALFLLGNSPLATRLAVGDFLQIHFGVTFLLPGEWGAEWSPLRVVSMPSIAHSVEPIYKWRFLSGVGEGATHRDWMRNNGLGTFPLFTHGLYGVFDAEIAKTRPDFFPLVGGQRCLPSGRGPWEPQPNLAAPGAATHAANRAADFFKQNPGAPMFSLGINDSKVWDESPGTTDFLSAGLYFRGLPDYSNYVFVFMNRVATVLWPKPTPTWNAERWREKEDKRSADSVERSERAATLQRSSEIDRFEREPLRSSEDSKYVNVLNPSQPPGAESASTPAPASSTAPAAERSTLNAERLYLGCLAYSNCERPPDFPLHPNIFPVLTADRSQWRDPVFRRHDSRLIRQWARSGVRHFGIYDYYYGHEFPVPRVFFDEEIDSIRWGAENGAKLFYAELYPDWGFDAPKAWLATRLLLYPAQNSALLLNHFFNEAYGPAAGPMREFFNLASAPWDAAGPARWLKFWHAEGIGDLISASQQAAMRTALNNAEAAFPGPGWPATPGTLPSDAANERFARQQIRVRMTSMAFAATERFLNWHRLRAQLQSQPLNTPADAHEMLAAVATERGLRREFEQARKRWNQSAVNPGANSDGKILFNGGVGFSALERLLSESARRADGPKASPSANTPAPSPAPNDNAWADVFSKVALFAKRRGAEVLVRAAANPGIGIVLLHEKLDADSFQELSHRPSTALGATTPLRAPWRTTLADCETLRFGFLREDTAAPVKRDQPVPGFLRICGADSAVLSRDVPGVTAGATVIAKVFIRGQVSPSTRASFALRFLDADGKQLPQFHLSSILRADANEWHPIVALGQVPAKAVAVRITLECLDQNANESLNVDNLTVSVFDLQYAVEPQPLPQAAQPDSASH